MPEENEDETLDEEKGDDKSPEEAFQPAAEQTSNEETDNGEKESDEEDGEQLDDKSAERLAEEYRRRPPKYFSEDLQRAYEVINRQRESSLIDQLSTICKNLNRVEEQIARHGMSPPMRLLNERDLCRENKARIEEELQSLNVTVEKLSSEEESDETLNGWFRELSVTTKHFVLTLCLFSEMRQPDFWKLYESMMDYRQIEYRDEEGEWLFRQSTVELLESAMARSVSVENIVGRRIVFKKRSYQARVLDLLRDEYPRRLLELLPWLYNLGQERWEIRSRAAEAVAEIGKIDFAYIRRKVLEKWANDQRHYVRAVIGYTVSKLLRDQVAQDQVRKMLNEWGDPKEHRGWKFRWAAAAAYKQIGLEDADLALNGLKEVARNDDIRIADAVIYALLVISFDDKLKTVLDALGAWLEEDEGSKKESNVVPLVATLAFLTLGNAYTSQAEREPDDGKDPEEDEFLILLAADGTWRSVVLSALAKTLKYNLTDEAFDVLKGWARQTGDDDDRLSTLCDLIADWYMGLWHDGHQIGMVSTLNRLKRWNQDGNRAVKRVARVAKGEISRRVDAAPLPSSKNNDGEKSIVFGRS